MTIGVDLAPFQSAESWVSNRIKVRQFSGVLQRPFCGAPAGVFRRDAR